MTIYNIIAFIILLAYCIYVVIYEKRSIKSDLIERTVKLTKYKTIISDEKIYDKYIEKASISNNNYKLPNLKYKCKIVKENFNIDYYIFNKGKNKKIFYLHGGSYIDNPLIFHIKFLDELAYNTDAEVIFPIYPKAPNYSYRYSYELVYALYNKLYKNDEVILMGDSAGGGFALSLSTLLRDYNHLKNINVIVLSPWLDITMHNRNIKKYEDLDPFLSKKALVKAGKLWSNNEPNNKILSPIYGDYKNINITLFIGTHEIFLPDARKFKKNLYKQGVNLNYYEYKYMNHVFPLYPIKEAKEAKKEIYDIIKKA